MGLAVNHPQKICSLTILNSAAFLSKEIPLRIAILKNPIGSWSIRHLNVFAKAATWMATKRGLPKRIQKGYLYPYSQPPQRIAIDAFVQDIPMSPLHPTYAVMQAIQNKLCVLKEKPCLLAWGMRDFCFTQKFFDQWKWYFPQAIEAAFPQAGHYVLEDAAPEILHTIRRFLTGITSHQD
jgi:haloalkane dehalogenase